MMKQLSAVLAGFLNLLRRSWIAAAGAVLATGAALHILVLIVVDATSHRTNPYVGILAFVVLPALFVIGLLMIPLGAWISRRRGKAAPADLRAMVQDPALRLRLALVAALTFVNVAILSTASFRAVETMETREFCSQTCHSVMAPEATAAPHAPHANVLCVSCHVGPGARGFLRAKLSGASQLAHLVTGTYSRPIPVPIEGASPARAVCLDCHALSRFGQEKMRVIRTFASDESSTPATTVLMLKIGGLDERTGAPRGIHWHIFPENTVEYEALDRERSAIPRVRVRPRDGSVREYAGEVAPPESTEHAPEPGTWYRMDCVDCHNRPAHTFELPGRAVDAALANGQLDRSLPWIKKNALEVLTRDYPDKATALTEIPRRLGELYPQGPADSVREAGRVLSGIYSRNVFPEMRVGWGTYPSHIGHTDSPGCFRCHDGAHTTADGRTITAECTACHALVAVEEPDPEVLKTLHPDSGAPAS